MDMRAREGKEEMKWGWGDEWNKHGILLEIPQNI